MHRMSARIGIAIGLFMALVTPAFGQVNPEITVHEVDIQGLGPTYTIVPDADWNTGGTGGWRGYNQSTYLSWWYEPLGGGGPKSPTYSMLIDTFVINGAAGGGTYPFYDTPTITCPANQPSPYPIPYVIHIQYITYGTVFWDNPMGNAQDNQKSARKTVVKYAP